MFLVHRATVQVSQYLDQTDLEAKSGAEVKSK